jgi:hypothetical protein
MRRFLLLFFALATPFFAADWYATSSSVNVNASNLWVPTSTGSCTGSGTALVWGAQAAADNFYANGCTSLAINADPGPNGTVTLLTTAGSGTAGGGFTYAAASALTLHAHFTAGTTACVTVSGTSGISAIIGNLQGGSGAGSYGVSNNQSGSSLTITGNLTGGSSSTSAGLFSGSSGTVNITGNVTPGSIASSSGLTVNASGVINLTGNCIGHDTNVASGCSNSATGTITITGSIINGKKGMGFTGGAPRFTPAATNYIIYAKDSSYVLGVVDSHATVMSPDPGVANVKVGTTYGPYTGTYAGGGASAYPIH